MPLNCAGHRPIDGDLYIPDAINVAANRARAEQKVIRVRRSTDGMYRLLIQAEDEIDPIEEERYRPVTYCTVMPDGTLRYGG